MAPDIPEAKKAEWEELKTMIRSFVLPHQDGISPRFLNNDYKEMEGRDIPYGEYGFVSLEDLLKSIKDTVRFGFNKQGEYRLFAIANEETIHIAELVQGQMKKKKNKKPNPRFNTYQRNNMLRTTLSNIRNKYQKPSVYRPPPRPYHNSNYFNAPRPMQNGYNYRPTSNGFPFAMRPPQVPTQNIYRALRPSIPLATSAVGAGKQVPASHPDRPKVATGQGQVSASMQNELKVFLSRYKPVGVQLINFELLFKHEMKHEFIPQNFSYPCTLEALKSIPQIIQLVKNNHDNSYTIKLTEWLPTEERPKKQFTFDIQIKLLMILHNSDGSILLNKISRLYYLAHNETLDYSYFGCNSWPELFAMQENFPVAVQQRPDGLSLVVKVRQYAKWACLHCYNGNADQVLSMAPNPGTDVARPTDKFQKLILNKMALSDPKGGTPVWKAAIISSVATPRHFWIYLAKYKERLLALMKSLDIYDKNNQEYEIPDSWLIIGLPVAALFTDNCWHRAVITDFPKDKEGITVYFVDYGGTLNLSKGKLRLLRSEFMKEPAFAIRVALYGIIPKSEDGQWSKQARDAVLDFSRGVTEKPLACCFYEKKTPDNLPRQLPRLGKEFYYEVLICDTSEEDVYIDELLITKGYAQKCKSKDSIKLLNGEVEELDLVAKMNTLTLKTK